jgi:glycosyltransferase involved in cell wall biosynthesis
VGVPDVRVALILPGFSSDESDWCTPALLDYVRALSKQIDVEVFTLRYPHRRDTYRIGNAIVHSLGGAQRHGLHSLALWASATRAISGRHRRAPFDLLHAFWAHEQSWVGLFCARWLRVPLVVSVAGGELSNVPPVAYGLQRFTVHAWLIRQGLHSADCATAGSGYVQAIARGLGLEDLACAPLGVDTAMFSPADMPRAAASILSVASLLPVKGHLVLLRAMRRVVDAIPTVHLTIVGDGPQRAELAKMIDCLSLGVQVTLHPVISHDGLPPLYQAAELYVQSSWHEAQGMAVLEAAACGTALAGTAVGVLADLAPTAAAVVPVGDESALAELIIGLLADPARRRALGCAARALVETTYSVEITTARFLALYAPLCA